MVVRGTKAPSWHRYLTWFAVEQFLPCLVADALVTAALAGTVPDAIGALPGLWQVLFSRGDLCAVPIAAARATFGDRVYDLASGVTCLVVARGESPWLPGRWTCPAGSARGRPAAVLHTTLERSDGGEP